MSNRQNLQNAIRLSIQGMVANNEDHSFEKMCYEYSYKYICHNVVMPTGGGNGDKGRDFYTIPIYKNGIKTEDIAFQCSLNKDIKNKIKSDISTLNKNFPKIKKCYFFAGVDLAESHQYNLIKYAKDTLDIELEIIDLNKFAQLLCNIENFTIVENFLHVPSSFYPQPEEENWYTKLKKKYQDCSIVSHSDFREVVACIRETTNKTSLKVDTKFWINKILNLIENTNDFFLKSRSLYEIAHSYLRGLYDLESFKQIFIEYVRSFQDTENLILLEDAVCILNYAIGTLPQEITYPDKIISNFNNKISNIIEKMLLGANDVNRGRLLFLEILLTMKNIVLKEKGFTLDFFAKKVENLIMELEKNPFFSATKVDETLKIFLQNSIRENFGITKQQAENFQDRIDCLISQQEGNGILGERIRDRMVNYVKNNDYLSAIKEGHKLKKAWAQHDSYYGCALSLAILAFCYEKIGLYYASKYYYLISIRMCIHSDNPNLFSKAMPFIYSLTKLDYLLGNWNSFFKLLNIYFTIYYFTERKEFALNDEESQELIFYSCIIKKTASFENEYDKYVNNVIKNLNCDDDLKRSILVDFQQENPYHTLDKLWNEIKNNIKNRPFTDINLDNTICFNTSGIEWVFTFKNVNKTRILAEEFISIIQILLLEMYNLDIMHLQTKIVINIQEKDSDTFVLEEIANNDHFEYKLFIPNFDRKIEIDNFTTQILSCCFTIIEKCSLLEQSALYEILENLFKNHLTEKLTFFSSYRNSYINLYELKDEENILIEKFNSKEKYKIDLQDIEIFIYDKLSTTYDEEDAKNTLRKRYTNSMEFLEPTLKILRSNINFVKIISEYKQLGYLDWELMMALSNILMDYKVKESISNSPLILTEEQKIGLYHKKTLEISSNRLKYNIPPKDLSIFFDKSMLDMQLKMNYNIELKRLGLCLKTQTPKFNAIKDFLVKRFMYNIIDVEHESIV